MAKFYEEKLSQASSKQQTLLKKFETRETEFEKSKEALLLEKITLQDGLETLRRQLEQSNAKEIPILEKIRKLATFGEAKNLNEIEFLAKSLLKDKQQKYS